jgi:DNA polymerase delta subunit 1
MPTATTITSSKRILGDATNVRRNVPGPSPNSAKKRKFDALSARLNRPRALAPPDGLHGKFGSSQPKSQFEEEVLDKLTQGMSELKEKNSEKDQQWARPSLDDFDENRDSLCFQQIEAEEGILNGGKTTVKLFGVTEVNRFGSSTLRLFGAR